MLPEPIETWMQDVTVFDVFTILIAAAAIAGLLKGLSPLVSALILTVQDFRGTPSHNGVEGSPGIMERLTKGEAMLESLVDNQEKIAERLKIVEEHSAESAFHSKPNHGNSAYDVLMAKVDFLIENSKKGAGE